MLWHYLLNPPDHPQFRRTLRIASSNVTWLAPLVSPLFCLGIWGLLTQLRLSTPLVFLAATIAVSSFYVVMWTVSISAAILREHEHGTYDQLCLAPSGALGANWAICTAVLHRNDALGWIDFLRKLMAVLLLFIFLSVLMTTALKQNDFDLFQFLSLLLDMITLVAMSYVDHVQSIVLGSLVAMLVPVYTRNNIDVRISTIVAFLIMQAITFLSALLVVLVIVPPMQREISPTVLSVGIAYLTRESLNINLWRVLAYHLNSEADEFIF